MSLAASTSRLVAVSRDLSAQWNQTRNYWRDAKAAEFEHRYLEELFLGVDRTVTILEKLDALLKKVREDCE